MLSLSLFLFLCPLKNGGHFSSALVSGVTQWSIGEIIYLEGLSETFAEHPICGVTFEIRAWSCAKAHSLRPHSQFLASGVFCKVPAEKAPLFRRKTIFQRSLSVRHPKGARSIGIGHPRSGDRCTKTLPYPLDPLWVAEQSLQRPRQCVAHTSLSISATPWRGRGIACIARSTGLRGYAPRPVAIRWPCCLAWP